MASPITGATIVCSNVSSDADKKTKQKRQSSASLAFVRWIHRGLLDSPYNGPVTRKLFPFDDVIMNRHPMPYVYHEYLTNENTETLWVHYTPINVYLLWFVYRQWRSCITLYFYWRNFDAYGWNTTQSTNRMYMAASYICYVMHILQIMPSRQVSPVSYLANYS